MKYLCCECGHSFKGAVKHSERKCPECDSLGSEHIPEICTPLDLNGNNE